MLDIFEPLFYDECFIVSVHQGVITNGWRRNGASDVIDPVIDVHAIIHNIYDLNRYSYGSRKRLEGYKCGRDEDGMNL